MDLQKIYTDSDFSLATVPDGQLLLFNAIEDGKPVTRYKDSNGNFGTLSGNGGGEGGGGSTDFYKCASVDTVNKTWTGYKAVLADGIYTFDSTVTTGLTYGTGFIPEVDTVYNSDATIKSSLWQGLKPAYYVLLDSQKSTATTGQAITEHNGGPTYTTADGVACADFSNEGGLSLPPTSLEGNEVFSVAVKCRITGHNDGKAIVYFGRGGSNDFGIWVYGSNVRLGTSANAGKIIDTGVNLDNDVWYELLVVKEWGRLKFYVGNELRDEDTFPIDIDITQNISIGMYDVYYGINAQVAEVKIYNTVVTPEQVWG